MAKKYSKRKRQTIYDKSNGKCVMCDMKLTLEYDKYLDLPFNYMQVDHFIPKTKGGTNDISNLFPICKSCNSIKGTYTIESAYLKIELIKEEIEKKLNLISLLEKYSKVVYNEI